MDVSENSGNPKSSILIGISIINHPFWGTPIFGNTHMTLCWPGWWVRSPPERRRAHLARHRRLHRRGDLCAHGGRSAHRRTFGVLGCKGGKGVPVTTRIDVVRIGNLSKFSFCHDCILEWWVDPTYNECPLMISEASTIWLLCKNSTQDSPTLQGVTVWKAENKKV